MMVAAPLPQASLQCTQFWKDVGLFWIQNQMMTEVYLTPLQYTVHILYILILSFNLILYKTIHCMVYVVESIILICDSMVYCGIWD